MFKNKLDFKLVNIAIVTLIVYLAYSTGNLWIGIVGKAWNIIRPFFFAFIVAYALYPVLQALQKKKVRKGLAMVIIIASVLGLLTFVICLIVPLLINQSTSLFNGIISFVKQISTEYDLNLGPLQESLTNAFNEIVSSMGKYVSDGAFKVINISLSLLSNCAIAFAAAIYFLADMDKIRAKVKQFYQKRNPKTLGYLELADDEMKNYLGGWIKVVFISLVEYTVAYIIIGHPNAILLGFLAAVANIIPYFGGIIANVVACVTSFVISPWLFIKTIICFGVLSTLDGYVINPFVYGKSNKVHPIITILAVFAGGILFGFVGIVISLPLAIMLITAYNYYEEDIKLMKK